MRKVLHRVKKLSRIGTRPKNVVIYTAITNDYDTLKPPTVVNPDYTYIAFVDSNTYQIPAPWQPRTIDITERNPRVVSRYYKILPHLCLPEYRYSIWIDASLLIKSDFIRLVETTMRFHNLALFRHPRRNCIYQEAQAIIDLRLDAKDVVERQMAHYRQAGYPADNGLVAGGFLIRKHQHPLVVKTMNQWWKHIRAFSHRDQLSGNYVFWKNKLPYYQLEGTYPSNEYIERMAHLKEENYIDQAK